MSGGGLSRIGWAEVGPGCFARRYESFDVTVGVVMGADGLLVVDTRGSLREGRSLRADLAALSPLPVRWVVDTHWHFDHCFGNGAFDNVPIYGHESVPAALVARAPSVQKSLARLSAEWASDMAELVLVPPSRTFASVAVVDLGDRGVELVHPGLAHTDGDVVVVVPDADVVYAGDLVESSGPPAYGDDAYPLEWPGALDVVSGLLTSSTVVVPGHGPVVDRDFVIAQRTDITEVADTLRRLHAEGVPLLQVPDSADWPFPRDGLGDAVARAYESLRESAGDDGSASRTSLPLLPPSPPQT